jgi:hypothetical protein
MGLDTKFVESPLTAFPYRPRVEEIAGISPSGPSAGQEDKRSPGTTAADRTYKLKTELWMLGV